eukprot:762575-Hanusia_phi.AAC.2
MSIRMEMERWTTKSSSRPSSPMMYLAGVTVSSPSDSGLTLPSLFNIFSRSTHKVKLHTVNPSTYRQAEAASLGEVRKAVAAAAWQGEESPRQGLSPGGSCHAT